MSNIVKYEAPTPVPFAEAMAMGKVFAESGFFQDTKGEAQAVTKIMAGQELGFQPIVSLTGIQIIKGRVSIGANLMAGAVKGRGKYDYKVRELTDTVCRVEFFQGSESLGISTFTIADAKKAGTQNLDKFPRNMLFARAISNGAKWFCPDILSGNVYTPEELGAEVNELGDIVSLPAEPQVPLKASQSLDVKAVVVPEPAAQSVAAAPTGPPSVEEALKKAAELFP